jgi:hypothetical protein
MNLYIVVDCKTHNCRTVHVLMHLGETGKTPTSVEYWMSYPLIVDCPTCGKTYDYSDVEEKFRQKELPAPPSGYSNRLATPWVQNEFIQKKTDILRLH